MIYVAKKGDEDVEAKRLSRRGFLSMLAGGAASLAVPAKSYFFFGNIARPAPSFDHHAWENLPDWAKYAILGPFIAMMTPGMGITRLTK